MVKAPTPRYPPVPLSTKAKVSGMAALIALVGAPAATLLVERTPKYEGVVLHGYLDPSRIPTKCMGDTHDVVVGKQYTLAECNESMIHQIIAHSGPAIRCAPSIRSKSPLIIWAAGDYAYNAGAGRFCSRVAPLFNTGRDRDACKAMGWPTTSKGKVLRGLVIRRGDEVAACLEGLK